MASTAPKADLKQTILKSGLLTEEELQTEFRGDMPTNPNQAASILVKAGKLTQYQASQLLAGKTRGFILGPYKLLRPLGQGGMGVVFLGQHKALDRQVAIKILSITQAKDKLMLERFFREARSVAALDHTNIVKLFDISQGTGGVHYLVFEYVAGRDLHAVMAETGPLHFAQAAEYIAQAAAGLQHAHEKGFVHRDIKPANLMLTKEGVIKILDMGLARSVSQEKDNLTAALGAQSDIVGTADFISPEQALGDHVDERSDIYSLGATLFALVAGHPPFSGSITQKLMHHQMSEVTKLQKLRGKVPDAMCDVIAKMMAKKPRERYQTAEAVIEALSPWLAPHSSGNMVRNINAAETAFNSSSRLTKTAQQAEPKMAKKKKKGNALLIVGGIVAALLVGLGVYFAIEYNSDTLKVNPAEKEQASTTEAPTVPIDNATYRKLPLGEVANASAGGPIFSPKDGLDRILFDKWGVQTVLGRPYILPNSDENKNNIITMYSPIEPMTQDYPKTVEVPVNAKVRSFHFLSGISSYGWPFGTAPKMPKVAREKATPVETTTITVKLHYVDGETESIEWKNGVHFADFNRREDVPESEFAFLTANGHQIRYLSIQPKRPDVEIKSIEFVKGEEDKSSPAIIAITVELTDKPDAKPTKKK